MSDAVPAVPVPAESGAETLLERAFPFAEVSHVISADRRVHDPVYGAHRWWARRPPALLRAALLAAVLPAETSAAEFWELYKSHRRPLSGLRVYDPFIGGGSTLVEAARLGALVSGGDTDPLAVELVRYELDPAPGDEVRAAGGALLSHLRDKLGDLYPATRSAEPLHYFWVHEVTCPACEKPGLLYRNLVLARDRKKPGAVVRDAPLTVFCPEDRSVRELDRADRVLFRYRGRTWRIDEGTYSGTRYTCTNCSERSTHRELLTGAAPRRLVGVEETRGEDRRRIRAGKKADHDAVAAAGTWLAANPGAVVLPSGELSSDRHDDRPRSFGMTNIRHLFTDRQLAVFGVALKWLATAGLPPKTHNGVELALSNALATNNKLCSYAYDYGRLSALFSVRGYSLPSLAVELNPLHPHSGRGTIHQCIERVARASTTALRRHSWSPAKLKAAPETVTLTTNADTTDVTCAGAAEPMDLDVPAADVCFFDPPYYDYIAYSELSEFFRTWRGLPGPVAPPLLPEGEDPGLDFGLKLGAALRATVSRLTAGRPIAFTYHSTNPEAWRAVGIALDEAKLRVTALWPVRSDGHMGHHSHPGNCEWDVVVVARRLSETTPATATFDLASWERSALPLSLGLADRTSIDLAIAIASSRFGTLATEEVAS